MNDGNNSIPYIVNQSLEKIYELIPDVIQDVLASDERAILYKKPWHERHRLGVIIESAKNQKK